MIAIKYIGRRLNFSDVIYGTGIAFAPGQTVNVEDDAAARKMLKHTDVYVRGELEEAETPDKSAKNTVTQDDDPDQTARDAIANMPKAALVTYAKTHFSADLDTKKKVGDLRAEVIGMFDRFGTE